MVRILGVFFVALLAACGDPTPQEAADLRGKEADLRGKEVAACSRAGFEPPRPVWRGSGYEDGLYFYCADRRGVLHPVLAPHCRWTRAEDMYRSCDKE